MLAHLAAESRCVAPPATVAPPGASEIRARWRVPLALVPDDESDPAAEWRGPCPRCKTPKALTVAPGHTRPVVSCLHCTCDPAAVHVILRSHVPGAPRPGKPKAVHSGATRPKPAADAQLAAAVEALALNDRFARSAPIRLALLEVLGYDQRAALEVLGITDASTRRRTIAAKSQAVTPKRRRPARTGVNARVPSLKAETLSPAETGVNALSLQLTEQPLTCGNTELTTPVTIVLAPEGNGHHTDTDTEHSPGPALTEARRDSHQHRAAPGTGRRRRCH